MKQFWNLYKFYINLNRGYLFGAVILFFILAIAWSLFPIELASPLEGGIIATVLGAIVVPFSVIFSENIHYHRKESFLATLPFSMRALDALPHLIFTSLIILYFPLYFIVIRQWLSAPFVPLFALLYFQYIYFTTRLFRSACAGWNQIILMLSWVIPYVLITATIGGSFVCQYALYGYLYLLIFGIAQAILFNWRNLSKAMPAVLSFLIVFGLNHLFFFAPTKMPILKAYAHIDYYPTKKHVDNFKNEILNKSNWESFSTISTLRGYAIYNYYVEKFLNSEEQESYISVIKDKSEYVSKYQSEYQSPPVPRSFMTKVRVDQLFKEWKNNQLYCSLAYTTELEQIKFLIENSTCGKTIVERITTFQLRVTADVDNYLESKKEKYFFKKDVERYLEMKIEFNQLELSASKLPVANQIKLYSEYIRKEIKTKKRGRAEQFIKNLCHKYSNQCERSTIEDSRNIIKEIRSLFGPLYEHRWEEVISKIN